MQIIILGYLENHYNIIQVQKNYSIWVSKLISKLENKDWATTASPLLCSWKTTNKIKNTCIRLKGSHPNIPHRKWRRQSSRRYTKGRKVMKKNLASPIQKLCFINLWKLNQVFLLTVYSLLLAYKKPVIAALLNKLRIIKMKSQANK